MRSISAALTITALALAACEQHTDPTVFATTDSSRLSTFRAALQFASVNNDLVDLMSSRGTLTVFAPDNDAWNDLAAQVTGDPAAVGSDLFTDANRAFLHTVLQYHIMTFTMRGDEIPYGQPLPMLEGDVIRIEPPNVIFDGRNQTALIIMPDIEATNGVTQMIDRVLLPPNLSIAQTLAAAGNFSIFLQVAAAGNETSALEGKNLLTLFVPNDAAYKAFLDANGIALSQLLADPAKAQALTTYAMVPGRLFTAQFKPNEPVRTFQGSTLTVNSQSNIVDAQGTVGHFQTTNVMATNGVIQQIDIVLVPQ